MYKGSIYYLENGARIRDEKSEFGAASALHGGIAYVTGDGTYFYYTNPDGNKIKDVTAYYGGFAYIEMGATVELKQDV